MKSCSGVPLLTSSLVLVAGLAFAESQVTLVRVQGNYRIPDADVLQIAGVEVGDAYDASLPLEIEARLARSGRFEDVEVRVRYRGLDESSDVALILVVREKPSVESRVMVAPIFDISDEYGVTYGGRPALVDIGVRGARFSFPLSWGGTREAGLEVGLPFQSFAFELARTRQIHPHFDVPDNRFHLGAGAGLARGLVNVDVRGRFSDVEFAGLDDRFLTLGASLKLDRRIDPTIPGDSYYLGLDWRRLLFLDGASAKDVNQFEVDVRGYKRLFGQSLFAVQAVYRAADGPLPSYEKPFLGGGQTLRGYDPGRFLGDSATWGSAELRVPLTSALSIARAGVHGFFDIGAVHDHGRSIRSARFQKGAGVGAFVRFAFIGIRLDLGWAFDGGKRISVASSTKF